MKYMCCFVRISLLKKLQNTNYANYASLSEICVEFANLAD